MRLGRFRGTRVIAFEAVAILDCGRTNTAANGNLAGEILRSLSERSGLGTQAKPSPLGEIVSNSPST